MGTPMLIYTERVEIVTAFILSRIDVDRRGDLDAVHSGWKNWKSIYRQ